MEQRRGLFSFQRTPSGLEDNVAFLTFELPLCVREEGGVLSWGSSRDPQTSILMCY